MIFGLLFVDNIIPAFGGKGDIFEPAKMYYIIVLYGVPFLALCMMGNTVIRAEGNPKFAMYAMLIPSIGNLILDVVFIKLVVHYKIFKNKFGRSIRTARKPSKIFSADPCGQQKNLQKTKFFARPS